MLDRASGVRYGGLEYNLPTDWHSVRGLGQRVWEETILAAEQLSISKGKYLLAIIEESAEISFNIYYSKCEGDEGHWVGLRRISPAPFALQHSCFSCLAL